MIHVWKYLFMREINYPCDKWGPQKGKIIIGMDK